MRSAYHLRKSASCTLVTTRALGKVPRGARAVRLLEVAPVKLTHGPAAPTGPPPRVGVGRVVEEVARRFLHRPRRAIEQDIGMVVVLILPGDRPLDRGLEAGRDGDVSPA